MNIRKLCRNGLKRVLAAVLAVCMLASVMPTGILPELSAKAAGDAIVYMFKDPSNKAFTPLTDAKYSTFDHVAEGSAPWKYLTHNAANSAYYHQGTAYGLYMQAQGKDTYIEFVVQVPAAGFYSIDANMSWMDVGTSARVTVYPSDENGSSKGTGIVLGILDNFQVSGGNSYGHMNHLTKQYIPAGYYILRLDVFRTDSRRSQFILDQLILNPISMDANIDTPAPAAFGEKVTAPITLKAADGSALTADSISAADCTIATIALSADKKNIEVTAGSTAGRQVAKITVTSGSLSETVNVPITVYDNSAASKDTYEYRFYKAPGKSRVDQMMTTFAASTEGHRWELVTNRHSMPYKLVGAPATTLHYPHSYGTLMTGTGSFDMHIHVPARSTYDFYTLYAPAPTGAKITYTIRRADGTGETQTIGTHNTFGEGYAASEAKVGTVKLDKGGEYIVNFKIENGGGSSVTTAYHGIKLVGLGDVTLSASAASPASELIIGGDTVTVPLTGLALSNGEAIDYSKLTLDSVECSDGAIASATLSKTDSSAALVVKAEAFGSTNLTANLSHNGAPGSVTIRVASRYATGAQPAGKDLKYDMYKGYEDLTEATFQKLTYNKTTPGAVGELNTSRASAPFAYFGQNPPQGSDLNAYIKYNGTGYGLTVRANADKDLPRLVRLKIQVPTDGYYIPSVTTNKVSGATCVAALYKYNAIANTMGDAVIGEVTVANGAETALCTDAVKLESGEYILEFGAKTPKQVLAVLDAITLTYKGASPVTMGATATAPTAPVTVGQSVEVPLQIAMSDNSAVNYANMTAEISCTDKGIVNAEFVKDASSAKVKVTGVKFGSTTVNVKLTSGSVFTETSFRVASRPTAEAEGKSLYFNLLKGYKDATAANYENVTYNMTTAGGAEERNSSITSDPWAYYGRLPAVSPGGNAYTKYNNATHGVVCVSYYDVDLPIRTQIKVQVPASGYYMAYADIFRRGTGEATTTLHKYDPINNTVGDAVIPTKILDVSSEGSVTADTVSITNAPVYLEAGEYVAVYGATKKSAKEIDNFVHLAGYGLTYLGKTEPKLNIEFTAPTTAVNVGGELEIPLTMTTSSGAAVDYSNITVSSEYTDKGIASASIRVNEGKTAASLVIKGESFGSTMGSYTISAGGFVGSISFRTAVRYAEGAQPAGKTLTYDIIKGYENTAADTPLTLTYNKTTPGAAGELNTNRPSEPWAYHSQTVPANPNDLNSYIKYNGMSYGLDIHANTAADTPKGYFLKIQVPTTGYYLPSMTNYKNAEATARTALYKYDPYTDSIGDVVLAQQSFSMASGGAEIAQVPIKLESGEYIIEFTAMVTKKHTALNTYTLTYTGDKAIVVSVAPQVSSTAVIVGNTTQVPLAIEYSEDGEPVSYDYTKAEVSVKSSDENIAKASATKTAEGISIGIEAIGVGAATITADVTIAGFKKSVSVTAMVDDGKVKDLYFNFMKAFSKLSNVEYLNDITYAHTTTGSASELNVGKYNSTPWAFFSKTIAQSGGYIRYNYENYGIAFYRKGTLYLKINVGADGWYKPSFLISRLSGTSNAKAALREFDADKQEVGGIIAESEVITPTEKTVKYWAPLGNKAVHLAKGEYIIQLDNLTSGSTLCYIDAFRLDAVKLQPEAPASIKVEDSAEIYAFRGAEYANESLAATVADTTVASVSVDKTTGKLTVTGLKAGETTLTATADGESYTIPIKIIDPNAPKAKSVFYDFVKLNPGTGKVFAYTLPNSYNFTAAGATDEMNADRTNKWGAQSGTWQYFSVSGDTTLDWLYGYEAAGKGLSANTLMQNMVRIIVPETGNYQVIALHDRLSNGANVTLNFYELSDTGIHGVLHSAGTLNTAGAAATGVETALPGVLSLKAGEYILSMDVAKGATKMVIDGILLRAPEFDVDVSDVAVARNASKVHTAYVSDSKGEIDMTGAAVNVSLTDKSVAEVTPIIEGGKLKFQIEGILNGETMISYEIALADGRFAAGSFNAFINPAGVVVANDLRYDFHKLDLWKATGDTSKKHTGTALNLVTSFDATTKGHPDEINPQSTVNTDPWHFVSKQASQVRYASSDYGLIFDYEPATVVFKIRVTKDGLYRAVSENARFNSGAVLKLWLAPDGAENSTADEYYLGSVDTYSEASQNVTLNSLKITELKAGDYTLTYKMDGKNDAVKGNGRAGLGAFILQGMNAYTVLKPSVEGPDMIPVGSASEFAVNAFESDGVEEWLTPVDVEVTMTNDILDYEIVQNQEKTQTTLRVTGKAEGNTIVSVLVSTGSVEETVTFPLTVYNAGASATRDYVYSFSGTMLGGMNIVEVDSFSKMMAGSPDEIRPNNGKTDPWCFEFQNASAFYVPAGAQDSYGCCMGTGNYSSAGIRIRLTASGIFTPTVSFNAGSMNSIFRTYIAPVDAEDPMDEKWSVGSWDTFNVNGGTHTATFRTLYLEAGDYIVSWELVGENPGIVDTGYSGKGRIWYRGITLKSVSAYPEITVNLANQPEAMKLGNSSSTSMTATVADGAVEDFLGAEFVVDPAFADKVSAKTAINPDGTANIEVTGLAVGSYDVGMTLMLNGAARSKFTVPVTVLAPGKLASAQPGLESNTDNVIIRRASGQSRDQIVFTLIDEDGTVISDLSAQLQNAEYAYASSDESIATVDENGVITPVGDGDVTITGTVTIAGVTKQGSVVVSVVPGKSRRSYYTDEKVAAAQENVQIYTWGRSTLNSAIKLADNYVNKVDKLWELVTTNEVPRSYYVGYRNDPNVGYCRYCGCNIAVEYGSLYAYTYDPLNTPWKIRCPDCRRQFPSNDFASFYKLGLGTDGKWHYDLALERNDDLVANGHSGYLVNLLYPEKGDGWGVDDGYGYKTGNMTATGVEEVHTYISFYNHWAIWHAGGTVSTAMNALANAYIYSGDAKYGRVGAILLDRIADVYPEQDLRPYKWQMTADASYAPHGKSVDLIWENQNAREYCKAYDAFFPIYDDPYVINYLSKKAAQYGMENPKTSANLIRENLEDGILRETFKAACTGAINGNFGMTHSAVAAAAVVLDTMPETREWIDWIYRDGTSRMIYPDSKQADEVTGGSAMRYIIDNVDRDGVADEIAPNYANIWAGGMTNMLDILGGYDKYSKGDLWQNPLFVKLIKGMHPLTMSRRSSVQIGDSGAVASLDKMISSSRAMPGWQQTGDPEFAQILYFINGNTTEGLHYDIFTRNPGRLADEVKQVIETYGEYDYDKSRLLGGYGLATLREGTKRSSLLEDIDTQSTYWMSFVRGAGHGHNDVLNLGVEAYGANIAPELGYPNKVIGDLYSNWGKATVSHNTVLVNQTSQTRTVEGGNPLHFDDSGMVKVMDAESPWNGSKPYVYSSSTTKYRRTVVTVNVDDEISYGVDFFRVAGGSEHLYSFHALSTTLPELGVNGGDIIVPVKQADENGDYVGTYAGPKVAFETEGVSSGFSYLKNVDRAAKPGNEVYVDFEIDDHRDVIDNKRNVHLKMTMLNTFDLEELAIADGAPAMASGNPETIKFMLAKRTGVGLDSLFTTVIEPYDTNSNIASLERLEMVRADGEPITNTEEVRAVKATLTNGRVDYIVYAEDNSIEYIIQEKLTRAVDDGNGGTTEEEYTRDVFNFKGFVGVYTEVDGENIYSYMNDGTKIGSLEGTASYSGTVSSFTMDNSNKNFIDVAFNGDVDVENLVGKYIYIDGAVEGNGAYEILGAVDNGDGTVTLDIGDVSLITTLLESTDDGQYTYNYNIQQGASFKIPLPTYTDNSPIFAPVDDARVIAGNRYRLTVNAVSPIDNAVTYEAKSIPRGATFNGETGEFIWTPDGDQIGTHVIAIAATDGTLSSSLYFEIEVAKATTSSSNANIDSNITRPSVDTDKDDKNEEEKPDTGKPDTEDEGDTTGTTGGFTDLGGYDWAKDSINDLASGGVVNGTGNNTFSPSKNITRADFALMMVRAFDLKSDSTENFADVPANAYYAEALAIGKAHGILNGVGENKYNPTETITRQDMMTVVSRALKALGYELEEADDETLAAFIDAAEISDYATEHVATMVANGLIKGKTANTIDPKSYTTRAEVAVLIDRLMKTFLEEK